MTTKGGREPLSRRKVAFEVWLGEVAGYKGTPRGEEGGVVEKGEIEWCRGGHTARPNQKAAMKVTGLPLRRDNVSRVRRSPYYGGKKGGTCLGQKRGRKRRCPGGYGGP